jgi:hypothetical protein
LSEKVFGIGLSKTGTTALYAALAQLGYRSITYRHMQALGLDAWLDGDFSHDYLAGIDAATDLPTATFFAELDERYPGSKFILTTRPVEAWLASIERQFVQTLPARPRGSFPSDIHFATYGVRGFHAGRFRRVHADHERSVAAHFADRPESLLMFDVYAGDGWEKLCGFLNRPAPEGPFPNVKPGFEAYPTPESRFPAYPVVKTVKPARGIVGKARRLINR